MTGGPEAPPSAPPSAPPGALPRAVAAIMRASARRAVATLAVWVALAAVAATYFAQHAAIDTDTTKLVSPELDWRQRELAFDRLFPQRVDLIVAVVDGATAADAERAAAALAVRLARSDRFTSVRRPDGGPFFERNGLLFLPQETLAATLERLIEAQPLLGSLAHDPSLRGLVATMALFASSGEPRAVAGLAAPAAAIATVLERAVAGESPLPLAWSEAFTGRPADKRELRRFVLAQPRLRYEALQSGEEATAVMRTAVAELGLTPDHGVRVRLTGPVPLADEEFATLQHGAALAAAATLTLLATLLALALRSLRLVLAVLASLVLALGVTAGLGLVLVSAFNLISVAFAVLCIGLGVDFGIQVGVNYRAQRAVAGTAEDALHATGLEIGGALALAALATALGFFSFLPTHYRGVSELGTIAGVGMAIAFLASITVIPALAALTNVPGAQSAALAGLPRLAPLDRLVRRRAGSVLAATFAAALGSALLLPRLAFDVNPLHLRSAGTESVATLLDLSADPETSPNTIDILAPTLDAAAALASRLSELPEVAQALTLASFVPDDQEAKLALIADAASLVLPALEDSRPLPAPSDEEEVRALRESASAWRQLGLGGRSPMLAPGAEPATTPAPETAPPGVQASQPVPSAFAATASRLAGALEALALAPPAARERVREALLPGLLHQLAQLRSALSAQPVTRASLPAELVSDWIAMDGQARVEVFPAGDGNDNRTLARFVAAVTRLAPGATGAPISIEAWGATIVRAFVEAGVFACAAVCVLLALVVRRARDVAVVLMVLLLSGLFTLALCAALAQPLNFENIIALPLLFGVGVAFNVYFLLSWRAGRRELLSSSLARAVVYSALTTASAFGTLWLSAHPGTASMGKVLVLSLACTLACAMLVLPALLAWRDRPR